ncbi:MAG: DUF2961 domain-containing protein [Candidatus Omnitrophica bacterium]|nr:DUF2961 domain-containing protein [Candidatus Omnitrophota bacterium]
MRRIELLLVFGWITLCPSGFSRPLDLLQVLASPPDFETRRISSYDRTGGNEDRLTIEPGETKVLAEIEGPGAITHIWNTIAAEKYYPRMLILRFYWDGQDIPSVEVPLGDFFGVGHGLDRAFQSFPVNASSDGRARNCYWYMPFKKSAKITVTHEGFQTVRAFYYYIDYQKIPSLPDDLLYFHAQYRQATPNPTLNLGGKNPDGRVNYVILETEGRGKYVGTVLSSQINADGWFGEGDDMFFVDGATTPTMIGTGTEDYFNDAWGFREFCYPFHGVPLWEGYKTGDRCTAYKWHLFDPVAFTKSLKVTIEHGHANDRQDDYYTVAYWYQTLPSPTPPLMANAVERLPDEGQLLAKSLFLNKEIAIRWDQGEKKDALTRIDEFLQENPKADQYGYYSLRKGLLHKEIGQLTEARSELAEALKRSTPSDPRAVERDAPAIHWLADHESAILEGRKLAHIYVASAGYHEVFVDGQPVGTGSGWQAIRDYPADIGRGNHVLAVSVKYEGQQPGLMIKLSHRNGFVSTDATWKVSAELMKNWNLERFDDKSWASAAEVGKLGESPWISTRDPFPFLAPLLNSRFIWSTAPVKEDQMLYFRKEFRIK